MSTRVHSWFSPPPNDLDPPADTVPPRIPGARFLGALGLLAMLALGSAARAQVPEAPQHPQTVEERLKALEEKMNAPDLLRVTWKDGLRMESADGNIVLRMGGRIHFDSEWNHTNDSLEATRRMTSAGNTATATPIGTFEDGWEIRRARIFIAGDLYKHVEFKAQYDFAKGAVADKDVYVGLHDLGDWIPNFRAGHQFEPFGLETLTSDNDLTFIEFDPGQENLAPFRNPGFMVWKNLKVDNTPRITWAAGVFRTDSGDNAVSSGDGAYDFTARLTGTPIWENSGEHMLHLGIAGTRRSITRSTSGGTVTLSSRPGADLLPVVVSTGAIPANLETKLDGEAACIWGPVSVMGEYLVDHVETLNPALDSPTFHAWYAQVAWTLTGETRRWNAVEAIPTTPRPGTNAFVNGGTGAWEAALRYSELDLNDGHNGARGIQGGELRVVTLGLNWYLNPNARVMWNFSHSDVANVDPVLGLGGDSNIFEMRIQVNF
jgi:phosphate-selective porin OprO/OprP